MRPNDLTKLWAVSYAHGPSEFAMQVVGTREEVESHCANLGLRIDGEVVRTGAISEMLARCFGVTA